MDVKNVNVAYISVGSNMGDKYVNCSNGISGISDHDACEVIDCSRFYSTEPVDYTDQDWFLNAVVKIHTTLTPDRLLETLQGIQRRAGRTGQKVRFGPRMLDLDIIFYNDLVIRSESLEIPHPRMHKRRFVLQPICDIDPAFVHPVINENVRNLLEQLEEDGQKVVHYTCCGS